MADKSSATQGLLLAAKELRAAQRDYMANRGNDEKGKAVALAAGRLDAAIILVEQSALSESGLMAREEVARLLELHAHHCDRREAEGATIHAATTLRDVAGEIRAEGSFVPSAARLTPKELIETVRGVLSAVKNGPVAVVVNNNQPGTQHIIETAPNVTLDVGTQLYAAPSAQSSARFVDRGDAVNLVYDLRSYGDNAIHKITMHGLRCLFDAIERMDEELKRPSARSAIGEKKP